MDQRERLNDEQEALRIALDGLQARIWTAMPAKIVSFDPAKVTCQAQVLIQGNITDKLGNVTQATLPVCPDCPVIFPHGGGMSLTFPLAAGDEGLLVFASRCIDNWWQLGDIRSQFEQRMHDLSDGFFLPGPYSQPRKPGVAVSGTAVQLRRDDGTAFLELAADGTININAATGKLINLTDPTKVTGALEVTGNLTADAQLTVGTQLVVAGGATIKRILSGSISPTFGTLGPATLQTRTGTLTGARPGDVVIATPSSASNAAFVITTFVSSNDTITISCANPSAATLVSANLTYNLLVIGVT